MLHEQDHVPTDRRAPDVAIDLPRDVGFVHGRVLADRRQSVVEARGGDLVSSARVTVDEALAFRLALPVGRWSVALEGVDRRVDVQVGPAGHGRRGLARLAAMMSAEPRVESRVLRRSRRERDDRAG